MHLAKWISLLLTNVVMLFSLLLLIIGKRAHATLSGKLCHSLWASLSRSLCSWGIIVLGSTFTYITFLSLCWSHNRRIMRIATVMWIVLAFLLLLNGVCFALVTGAITSIDDQHDLDFGKVREQANQTDDTTCPMSLLDAACKEKIKQRAENSFQVIGSVLAFTCVGFVFVFYVTLRAVS